MKYKDIYVNYTRFTIDKAPLRVGAMVKINGSFGEYSWKGINNPLLSSTPPWFSSAMISVGDKDMRYLGVRGEYSYDSQ